MVASMELHCGTQMRSLREAVLERAQLHMLKQVRGRMDTILSFFYCDPLGFDHLRSDL